MNDAQLDLCHRKDGINDFRKAFESIDAGITPRPGAL